MSKLLPCPFCGGEANNYTSEIYMSDERCVGCSQCGAKAPPHKEDKYAFELWNDRYCAPAAEREPVSLMNCAMALQGNERIKLGADLRAIAKVVLIAANVPFKE